MDNLTRWLMNGEVGLSSKAMAAAIFGGATFTGRYDHPRDPDDFNRCLKFLRDVPEAVPLLHRCRCLSREWEALVDRWSEVEQSFLDEVGIDWCKGKRAQKTYDLMRSIYKGVE